MGTFRILGDSAVHDILINLPKADILAFRDALAQCLVDFSVGPERSHQPPVAIINRPEGQKCLFRPFTSPNSIGAKLIVDPAPSSKAAGGLHGILALCDQDGLPTGILNAEEVTGYRTALSALIPYLWRRHTDNIVVFGAGKQALWHIRLALALRGDEIKAISIVNRSVARAVQLFEKIKVENQARWRSAATMEYVDPSRSDYDGYVERLVTTADAIFCTVGSTSPLFPVSYITNGGRERHPYVSAAGSWQPDMMELDPALLRFAADNAGGGFCWPGSSKGVVLADDREGVLQHSGEVRGSGLTEENLVEVGQVEDLLRRGDNKELSQWLEKGLVIYKSVGVSLTDLAAGNAILDLAEKRGLGVTIPEF